MLTGGRMGISTQRATVNMYGVEKFVDAVLSRDGKKTAVSAFMSTENQDQS